MSESIYDSMSDAERLGLPANLPQSTVSEIVSWLVGHRVEAIERALVLHTLSHCSGNRAWAASVLGIPEPELKEKIRAYRRAPEATEEAAAEAAGPPEQEAAEIVEAAA
jgi:DNA-binding NtrC family response regulator